MSLLLTFMELDKLYEAVKPEKWFFKGTATIAPGCPNAGKRFDIEDFIQVNGKSEIDAIKNVKYKICKDNGLAPTKLNLSNYNIFAASELEPEEDKTCPACEKAELSDGGICRVCGYEAENKPGEQILYEPRLDSKT